jgi:regulator of protease activity HflC (stomatin/prohibitin superfamily)
MNIASLIGIIAAAAWVIAFAFLGLVIVRLGRNRPLPRSGVTLAVLFVLAAVISTVSSGLVFISPQERGVVISAVAPRGYREQSLSAGLHWIIPFAESVVRYPISSQTYTMSIASSEGPVAGDDSITARTSDGQEIFVDASVIYSIDPTKVVQVHIQWQDRYAELVRAQARGIVRDVVSQYGVEEVVSSKRLEMVAQLQDAMRAKLEANGLLLQDYILRNITFSAEYAASVEQKQISEQQAQQAQLIVEQRKQEAEQARQTAQGQADALVIRAKGDAESRLIEADAEARALLLIADAIKDNPDLLTYQYIGKLAPNIQTMLLPSDSPFLFPLPGANQGSNGIDLTPDTTPDTNP